MREDIKNLTKLDVMDRHALKRFGFDPTVYYAGNWSLQSFWTKVRDTLRDSIGLDFPYNEAAFKHDLLYSKKPTITETLEINKVFYNDMMKLLDERYSVDSDVYPGLQVRAKLFYWFVNIAMPFYIFQKKIQFKL